MRLYGIKVLRRSRVVVVVCGTLIPWKQTRFFGLLFLLLLSSSILGQSSYTIISAPKLSKGDFYIVDTIELKNPVIFQIAGRKKVLAMICDESEVRQLKKKRKKYIYHSYPIFRGIDYLTDLVSLYNIAFNETGDLYDCSMYEFKDYPQKVAGYVIKRLSIKTTRFIICFIRAETFNYFSAIEEDTIPPRGEYVRLIVPIDCEGTIPNQHP